MEPLAITGVGVVSPVGIGFSSFCDALRDPSLGRQRGLAGRSTVLTEPRFEQAHVAEVRDFDAAQYLGDKGLRNFDRLTRMLMVAAKQSLEAAGIKRDGAFVASAAERVGICAATAYGSLDSITEINRVAILEHPRYLNPSRFPNTVINSAAGYVSIWENLQGPNVTIVDGNCGSLDAVLTAQTHLSLDRADVLLVGGYEVLSEPLYLAFVKLGLINEGELPGAVAGEPHGAWLGEGAALFSVERLAHARVREAKVWAELVGFGAAFEPPASEAELVHASAQAVERALRSALADAGLAAGEIDLVCSSESGVGPIDQAEGEGLLRVLGPHVPTMATKACWGETFGAAGAFSMASAVAFFSGVNAGPHARGQVPPYLRHVLVITTGYYGNVSAVILRKASET